jgi:hypothetical protein
VKQKGKKAETEKLKEISEKEREDVTNVHFRDMENNELSIYANIAYNNFKFQ